MPILFFGSRAVRTRLGSGRFECPRCGVERRYELVRAQRHAHLYWVPLIKLGSPQEFVECQSCRAAYAPAQVLARRAGDDDLRGAITTASLAALASLTRAASASEHEVRLVTQALHALEGYPSPSDQVAQRLAAEPRDVGRAERGLAHIEPTLDSGTREGLMSALLHMAHAQGAMSPEQSAAVRRFAAALQVSPAHLRGLMLTLSEQRALEGGWHAATGRVE